MSFDDIQDPPQMTPTPTSSSVFAFSPSHVLYTSQIEGPEFFQLVLHFLNTCVTAFVLSIRHPPSSQIPYDAHLSFPK